MKTEFDFKNKIPHFIFLIVFIFSITSCKKDDESTPIILPPGTEVQYSTADFYTLSEEFYDVELKKYDSLAKKI